MNTQITPFAFGEQLVRTTTDENGNPWFVAKDVCNVLELGNVTEAARNLDDDERRQLDTNIINPDVGGRGTILISESGLYALIFRSRKSEAKRFSKWVRAEVLPTLSRTGSYTMPSAKAQSASITTVPESMVFRVNEFTEVKMRFTNATLRIAEKIGLHDEQKICALFDEILILFSDEEQHYAKNMSIPTETLCMLWNEVCHLGKASYKYSMSWRLNKFLELCHLVNNTFPTQKVKKDNLRLALCTHISSL